MIFDNARQVAQAVLAGMWAVVILCEVCQMFVETTQMAIWYNNVQGTIPSLNF